MAKVWDYQGTNTYPVIVEDPRAGNDGFYIDGFKHDKTSLTPQFNRKLNYRYDTASAWYTRHNNEISNINRNGMSLALSKLQTGCNVPHDDSQDNENWVDIAPWVDMSNGEGGRKGGAMASLKSNDGSIEAVVHTWDSSSLDQQSAWPQMENTQDLDQVNPSARGNFSQNYGHKVQYWGKGYGSSTTYQPGLRRGDGSSNFFNYPSMRLIVGYHGSHWPNNWASQHVDVVLNMSDGHTLHFLGESNDGNLLLASCDEVNSIQVTKNVWTTSHDPTQTSLLSYNTAPAAAGSHQGGNNSNNFQRAYNMSEVFDDPRGTAGTNKCWYRSYYDSYYNWHPLVVTWDKSTDTFAVETDITTNVNSSIHADLSTVPTNTGNNLTWQWSAVTWTSGGTRYVSEFRVDGRWTVWDTNEAFRTWVTYSVDAANPKVLTYHSKVTMPTTPHQWIWLNDSHTLMGVWFTNQFIVFSWNDSTGWTQTSTVSGYIHECGRDSLDRIWYTKPSSVYGGGYPELHLLTPTLPVSITVSPENSDYTYSGSNINTYVNVSAVNASGARIATSVKLVIEGSSMTFSDSTTQKTVTTLTTGELQVDTIITGAGFTNIAASIEI